MSRMAYVALVERCDFSLNAENVDVRDESTIISIIEGGEASGYISPHDTFWCLMWPQGEEIVYALDSAYYHDEDMPGPEWKMSEVIAFSEDATRLQRLVAARVFLDPNDAEKWAKEKCSIS